MVADMVQTLDRNGNRVLIGSSEHIQAFGARTSGTVGVWDWQTMTGWSKDDRDFTDVESWRNHITQLVRES